MIKQILELVRENSQELIIDNPQVPNESNDAAIALVADTLLGGIKQMAANPAAISGLMSGTAGSGLLQQVIDSAVSRMSSELNLSAKTAHSILSQLLPKVMAAFGSKLADPLNSEFTINGLLQHLTGAEIPGELTSMLEKLISPNGKQADPGVSNMLNLVMGMMGETDETER